MSQLHSYFRSKFAELLLKYGYKDKFGLDIGCGTGSQVLYSKVTQNIVCADVCLLAVKKLVEKFRVVGIAADAKTLPFPDNYFDFIYASGVVHHLIGQKTTLFKFFKEFHRVLKPHGHFCFMDPNLLYPISLFIHIPNRILQFVHPGARGRVPYERPILYWEVLNPLQKVGFSKIVFEPVSYTNPILPQYIIDILLRYEHKYIRNKILKYFSSWIIICATKI